MLSSEFDGMFLERGLDTGSINDVATFMHFINLLSPSPPKLKTEIFHFAHSSDINFHLGITFSAENLLLVPKHAKQTGGTLLHNGCAM